MICDVEDSDDLRRNVSQVSEECGKLQPDNRGLSNSIE
jgi:hypothetical protein